MMKITKNDEKNDEKRLFFINIIEGTGKLI